MRIVINAAVINDKKELLLVKKKETWILPGGKPESGELELECLYREVFEELGGAKLKDVKYYGEFEGKTPHKGDILKAKVYFAQLVDPKVKPSAEIKDAKWISNIEDYQMSDITSKIAYNLQEKSYL